MKHFIYSLLIICLAFAKASCASAQTYKKHTVDQGETLYSITQLYDVTEDALVQLNPDLKSGLKMGAVLLIPEKSGKQENSRIEKYITHKVKRKDNLFRLAQKYGIDELDIKEANKELYSKPLKRGDKIRIPVFAEEQKQQVTQDNSPITLVDGQYKVLPKDTKYGIATRYGIKVKELEKLNDGLDNLQPGMIINVPKKNTVENEGSTDASKFVTYTVPAKMGMYSLTRLAGISEDSIISLNPDVKEGLKVGMQLKLPARVNLDNGLSGNGINTNRLYSNLRDSIVNYDQQRIAVMLPLSLHKITEEQSQDDRLQADRTLRIALDFYSGMQVARDSAKKLGIDVNFDLYDTRKSLDRTKSILNQTDFSNYNTIIGPLMGKNVVEVAKHVKGDDIPVVSPLTTTDVRLYKNLFQSRPVDELFIEKMQKYILSIKEGKNIIIVTDNTKPELKNLFANLVPEAKLLIPNQKKNYIFSRHYFDALDKEKENLVILAVDNVGFITDAVSNYSAKADDFKITMIGMDNYEDMDLSNTRLAQLNYIYPKMNRDSGGDTAFAKAYYRAHNISPNEYATRGFDVTMDVILRQASASDLFESAMRHGATTMVENKFDYRKKFLAGYYNEAVFLLQYQKDLSIKVIDVDSSEETKEN